MSLGYDLKNLYVLYDELYYDQTFLHFVFNTSVLMLELSLFHFMLNRFRPAEAFVRFCGKNLNGIFLVQWVIIGVWVGFGGSDFGFWGSVLWGLVIAFASIGIVRILPPFDLTKPGDGRVVKTAPAEREAADKGAK